MYILITGASGFVGSQLIKTLSNQSLGYQLVVLSRKENFNLSSNILQLVRETSDNFFDKGIPDNIDVIIHLAGRAHILNDQLLDPLDEFRKVNVDGTLQLARQALEKKVKRFIFISSIGVNGAVTSQQPFTEDALPQPHADYALSKLEAEEALKILFAESDTELVIIRPPLVYAAHAPGNFARLLKLVATNLPLPFAGTKNRRSFVALENLVDFIQICIEHPNAANQTFLVADQSRISTRELVQYLKQGMGKPARFIYLPQPLMKLGAACIGKSKLYEQLFESLEVDTTKAQKLLGWTAPLSTQQAMLQAGQNYLKMKE
ncbi:NAD-dependent epimerase/dehydratase family protein [Acinetobacter towneri]|uniref:NAD-dependent epimerase/dehydratase family protein n=1 Tax=Acinetobacter towneri TaxID=202956 RepID=A0ABX7TF29_9GAMM|nr:NAD-dependent epimerase/dehydratase family protein [Acinetobacter towneri]QTD59606.1 NAD-dependent epimerase/dehydratase family protein [Acinetobacter towneri]QTD61825.1 NAD-dependent epimerase/dehydratase family protein [Acinetobacter towneri]